MLEKWLPQLTEAAEAKARQLVEEPQNRKEYLVSLHKLLTTSLEMVEREIAGGE